MNTNPYQQLLLRWQGGNAYVLQYSASHGQLIIEVKFEERRGKLQIICLDTEKIFGVMRWSNCNIVIEETNYKLENGIPIQVIVKEKKGVFEAHCGTIQVDELND